MTDEELEFATQIARPWETINRELSKPLSVDPSQSDFTTRANGLAVSINHFAEANRDIKPITLVSKDRSFEIISDLADSSKHRRLAKASRECELCLGSMYERNDDGEFRFLRNVLNISHQRHGKIDFIACSMSAAVFVANELGLNISWDPQVLANAGAFSNKMNLHISRDHQTAWRGMELQIVRLNERGEYEPVDMNSTVDFTLTSDF